MGRTLVTTNTGSVGHATSQDVFGTGNYQVFLQSGTFTTPTGVTLLRVRCWGGGGGGGLQNNSATGGGGGGYAQKVVVNPTSSYSVTIGAGGDASPNNTTNPTA